MTVRVLFIGRLLRQTEAQERHDRRGGVGQVVHGVCRDGEAPRQKSRKELSGK